MVAGDSSSIEWFWRFMLLTRDHLILNLAQENNRESVEVKQGQIVSSPCSGGEGCRVQEGANLLLFLPGCTVLCDTNLSPLARAIPGVSQALGWGRSTTAPTAWARGVPPCSPGSGWETQDVFLNYPGKVCIFLHARITKGFHYLLWIFFLKKNLMNFWSFANEQEAFESLGWWANKSGRRKPRG